MRDRQCWNATSFIGISFANGENWVVFWAGLRGMGLQKLTLAARFDQAARPALHLT